MKKIFENKKAILAVAFVLAGLFLFQGHLMAEGLILNRTGTLQVTDPAGVVSVIKPADPLPGIVSGSKVEVSSGVIEIAPSEGFIQLLVAGSVATVKAGDKVKVSLDPATGKADFAVDMGSILIVTGNTTTTLKANQQALITLDKVAGIATVESLAGDLETVTVGVKTVVLQGSTGQMSADAKTRNVHIENPTKG
jgi:hypothetical protein